MNGPIASAPHSAPPSVSERTRAKGRMLVEALSYAREHAGSIVVVKIGGAAMLTPALLAGVAKDIALLRLLGIRPAVVHGGGPQVTAMAARLGIEPAFVDGHRVTDETTLEVVRMVLAGLVNKDLVTALVQGGTPALGLSGQDAGLLRVRRRSPDLGLVGEVEHVDAAVLQHLMERFVPVIASIGVDAAGHAHNVNADLVAGSVAVALGAVKLVYLSDAPRVIGPDGGLISEASASECEMLLAGGVAEGGMRPKLTSAVEAIRGGVPRAHLLDGRVERALILELFTSEGMGTMVTPDGPGAT